MAVERDHPATGEGEHPTARQLVGDPRGADPLGEPVHRAEPRSDPEHRRPARPQRRARLHGRPRVGVRRGHHVGADRPEQRPEARRHRPHVEREQHGTVRGRSARQARELGKVTDGGTPQHLTLAECRRCRRGSRRAGRCRRGAVGRRRVAQHRARAEAVELAGEPGPLDEQRDAEVRRRRGPLAQVGRVGRGDDDGGRLLEQRS
jgi:hypothetical protein